MELQQAVLENLLEESMNDATTAWVISGHYELPFLVSKVISGIPHLADSAARPNGFAYSDQAKSRWICVDADQGSAVFLFPEDASLFNREMHHSVLALKPELGVNPSIYGNVDPIIFGVLGGSRRVVPAEDFLP
jgi:hypothetical protein